MFSVLFNNNTVAASLSLGGDKKKNMYITTMFIMLECLVVMCFCKVGIKFAAQVFMCFIFRAPPCMHADKRLVYFCEKTLIRAV